MSETVTHQYADDNEKPPPCPWCNVPGVREITTSNAEDDTRWFICQSCSRVFSVRFEPPPKKE
jgi:transposase-like protein